jgi:hypothetical protein
LVAEVVQSIVPAGTTQIPPSSRDQPISAPGITPDAPVTARAAGTGGLPLNTATPRLDPVARPEIELLAVAIEATAAEPPDGVLPIERVQA